MRENAAVSQRPASSPIVILAIAIGAWTVHGQAPGPYRGWPAYGGGPEGIRYSSLDQINRENVRKLEIQDDLRGAPPQMPPLVGIGARVCQSELTRVVRQGVGRMPGSR